MVRVISLLALRPGVCYDGSRDGDALLLPTAQLRSTLAAEGVVPIWQRRNEQVGVCLLRSLLNFSVGGQLLAESDILSNAAPHPSQQ
jgi:hypothetical protein